MTDFYPRPAQEAILAYPGGTMGVSAVPGSGKTWTLSKLASQIITEGSLADDQEILIVTLTNSAVNNFSMRIEDFLKQATHTQTLVPAYRIRTLHGLAHDIVRERPDLVGLDSQFQIIDEREADRIRNDVANAWLRSNVITLDDFLDPEMESSRRDWIRREHLPKLVQSIALSFIRTAKDMQRQPAEIITHLEELPMSLPLAEMGASMYSEYQRALAYHAAVDFDDLIRLALLALKSDAGLLSRLQYQWPFILEDEAQDSSRLQEQILKLLAQPENNWVRVGDPNQAIFESFTTANPQHLRDFMTAADSPRELPNSGRSTNSIIELANYLIDWSRTEHPNPDIRDALAPPYIEVVPPGEGGSNPPDAPEHIHFINHPYTPAGEVQAIANSLKKWLETNPNKTVAVLAPRNLRGFAINDALHQLGIPTIDSLLRSSSATRFAAGALANMLRYLSDPKSSRYLATIYKVWRRADREDSEMWAQVESTAKLLVQCHQVEDFIMPAPRHDWLAALDPESIHQEELAQLEIFRLKVQHWQRTIHLPIDQMVLTLSQELFTQPSDLAVAHKLAVLLRSARNNHPDWHLPELTEELAMIAKNERRFLGFSDEDSGFDPNKHKGEVVIATVHKAKGLEWDRVYLMSVNNYDFPSGESYDRYISERWFIRDNLNLEAETLAQLQTAFSTDAYIWYEEGTATYKARMEYVRERLRLLYVGITRARRELVVTWNDGQRGQRKGNLQPALPFVALQSFWEHNQNI